MNTSLTGKTAVVCGSTQGIGLATAIALAKLGATCILLARNEETLKTALAQLPVIAGQQHRYVVADFAHPEQVQTAIQQVVQQTTVHILINNTGGPKAGPVTEATQQAFVNAFNQHLVCNHLLTQAVIPSMKDAGYGRIVNVISTSVKIPLPNLGVSNTIRGAVASWAKTMANELGQFNITVNNVLPGFINTQRLQSLVQGNAQAKQVEDTVIEKEMKESVPMKRFGEAEEIAAVAAFLASPAASYVNGVSIPVDGGRTGSL